MKTDARVRYTRTVIKSSFIKLLKEKPLSKVTVKEICKLAEINRATFYKHYCDAYDLLEKLEQEFLIELNKNITSSASKGFRDIFTFILTNVKADSETYQTLFSENGDQYFPNKIFVECYNQQEMQKEFHRLNVAQQQWIYYFVAHGCSGILNQWIADGMVEPIHEAVDFADQLVQSIVKQF